MKTSQIKPQAKVIALQVSRNRAEPARWMVDDEQSQARTLVDRLYAIAGILHGQGLESSAEEVSEAAAMLDGYQAGLVLATPHPLTGHILVKLAS